MPICSGDFQAEVSPLIPWDIKVALFVGLSYRERG